MNHLSIGIDIGGTFTDFVIFNKNIHKLHTFKIPSTPHDPALAVINGLSSYFINRDGQDLLPKGINTVIIHGSTVATNILLERKGAPTALITTAGFRDVLQIGRQNRPTLYNFFVELPSPLVPQFLRFEVNERVDQKGIIHKSLDLDEVDNIIKELHKSDVTSVAVCLLFSFLHPDHERAIGKKLRQAGFRVSLSSEISPIFREYERTSTTVVNAYVSPAMDAYLSVLEKFICNNPEGTSPLNAQTLRIMQSNGGSISINEARQEPVRCILSGPAGGVIGSRYIGQIASQVNIKKGNTNVKLSQLSDKLLTFDMGGTSTDVSIINGKPTLTTESIISGCPINLPMLDIHTIGAGGGSIAFVDAGGVLRVGPESAGADPGPACYGKGIFPTVTDANLILGRILPDQFLGGQMPLDLSSAYSALENLGKRIGFSAVKTALGIISIVNAHMERALRVISVERGHDPREYTLLSFGGAGGLHACSLAQSLGIKHVLIPPMASTFSAFGMLVADVIKDYSQTVMLRSDQAQVNFDEIFMNMIERGKEEISGMGFPANKIKIERSLDIRYQGQSYEINVPFSQSYIEKFHRFHKQYYGYAYRDTLLEIVNIRVRAIGKISPPSLIPQNSGIKKLQKPMITHSGVYFEMEKVETPVYRLELLGVGFKIRGPAIIIGADTTILVPPSSVASVDPYGNLLLEVR